MKHQYLKKFYQKTQAEKIQALVAAEVISKNTAQKLQNQDIHLPETVADQMTENYITNFELPLGVAMNFIVNNQPYVLPMVTEEPSVIAAASYAGKIIGKNGGFQTTVSADLMIGQLAFFDVPDMERAQQAVIQHEATIIEKAQAAHPSIVRRGGGARAVKVRPLAADPTLNTPAILTVHLLIDTQEAMGANIVNTMLEGVAPYVETLVGAPATLAILSNYATEALVTARCQIEPDVLTKGEFAGDEVRDQIVKASQLATVDPYRAVTHNKGIMNGVTALITATGNDTRAVEAAAHAYAARSGQYRGLATWKAAKSGALIGELTLPLALGTVGGTINSQPLVQLAHEILDDPTAQELAQLVAALGLGQNFSALYALVTEGIQKGHMSLQAKSLALSVGARPEEVPAVVASLKKAGTIDTETAKKCLAEIRAAEKTDEPKE